ncbi:hypothetical protein [Streptomyces sp. SID3343]|uniref:hypothetical protein n=1 Tax=Streptomyces sp. SID3343 TaxID=2690260 RepID=UPI00136AF182|nr:hypothetical protein [Streptomyces sp. SID3343]MYV98498.1 hypothetical protein [Streptomyces sp. SID3343]
MPIDVYTALSALVRAEATRSASSATTPDSRPAATAESQTVPDSAADTPAAVVERETAPPVATA